MHAHCIGVNASMTVAPFYLTRLRAFSSAAHAKVRSTAEQISRPASNVWFRSLPQWA